MKFFIIATFFGVILISNDLQKIRQNFPLMNASEKSVIEIKQITQSSKQISLPLKTAYYAAAEMASAQYKFNPISKINTFNFGKKVLENAVKADSLNLEIRYIRYTIQTNAPSFLGYNKNISADQNFLIKNLKSLKPNDTHLYNIIYNYLVYKGIKKETLPS